MADRVFDYHARTFAMQQCRASFAVEVTCSLLHLDILNLFFSIFSIATDKKSVKLNCSSTDSSMKCFLINTIMYWFVVEETSSVVALPHHRTIHSEGVDVCM